jgi:hypothetical protein
VATSERHEKEMGLKTEQFLMHLKYFICQGKKRKPKLDANITNC